MSYHELSYWFLEELLEINNRQKSNVSENCIGYLSDLLIESLRKEFLFKKNKYLFDMYIEANSAQDEKNKADKLRFLGDYSLVISGYFTESIKDNIGIQYYISMGSAAYNQTAAILNEEPFEELAVKYIKCLNILNELSAKTLNKDNQDILRLYSFWKVTKNPFTKKKLLKLGMLTEVVEE